MLFQTYTTFFVQQKTYAISKNVSVSFFSYDESQWVPVLSLDPSELYYMDKADETFFKISFMFTEQRKSYRFWITWKQDDIIFIFGRTIPLKLVE